MSDKVSPSDEAWPDIGFYATYEVESHFLCFKVYEIDGHPREWHDGEIGIPQVYCSGTVKWDSCSNIYFDAQDHARLHFCGKDEAMNIGVLLGRLYEAAARLVPRWHC